MAGYVCATAETSDWPGNGILASGEANDLLKKYQVQIKRLGNRLAWARELQQAARCTIGWGNL